MISAIVVSYRTGPWLTPCLEALRPGGAEEIVLVDNGNPPEAEPDILAACARTGAHRLVGHGNIGFGAACNLGARAARGDFLAFVNPDLVARPGALVRLQEAAQGRPGPRVIGGRILSEDGKEQRGGRRDLYTPWNALVAASGLGRLERLAPALLRNPHRERDPVPPAPIEVGAISGALFGMPREDYWALGGFDEGFFLHVEDVDLCARARAAGGAVLFAPAAEGVHAKSTSDAPSWRVARAKADSFERYFLKHASRPGGRALGYCVAATLRAGLMTKALLGGGRARLRKPGRVL